jgi:imidazolonepropionase-like amidohydrolase
MLRFPVCAAACLLACASAQTVLTHVRVIDGTGAPPRDDQTIIIHDGRIASLGPSAAASVPPNAKVQDLNGRTVFPGLVMLHEHTFYTDPTPDPTGLFIALPYSFPRLYLAAGVTTLRTGGTVDPYADLALKKAIDSGKRPGPEMFVTGPYLEGSPPIFFQAHPLQDAEDARRMVNYWADEGVTSFKAYMDITRAELGAAINAAHARGLKVTGHLCSVTFHEAADLGIDNLEHGFLVATDFVPGKKPDVCADTNVSDFAALDVNSDRVRDLIRYLVDHHVAITSTLPVFEAFIAERPLNAAAMAMLDPEARRIVEARRQKGRSMPLAALQKEEALERSFVAAGGTLLAGTDPTGNGGALPGFGSQREVELLVEAGFTPLEALGIASLNGARFLGIADHAGTIAPGKSADLVVVRGNPATRIGDIENVEAVYKNGVRYTPAQLLDPIRGKVGRE